MSRATRFAPSLPVRPLTVSAFVLLLAAGCRHAGARPATAPVDQVNVGYATLDRRDVTGAVTSLDERDLRDLRVTHVEELLRDRVPGLLVTRGPDGGLLGPHPGGALPAGRS